ncbi:hypothetical protein HRR90_001335 [Exophiala dermatitidis]|nr:hypothetical protein HRR73_008033 [Exophiala dermatitidis]KAJ4520611.1 hypothetical protein HRR74_003609 [Exophiala dermatitidis]KAJ4537749.1 hypothetical protein HRR76_005737 [Exophiala dermatitidis]KAJ4551587.1 hypothetical protein HRR77_002821 [Exophiala dermatitidis]KAJ4572864.1 hypothetical protein HRR81_005307 [Exophiala dermatitidis]
MIRRRRCCTLAQLGISGFAAAYKYLLFFSTQLSFQKISLPLTHLHSLYQTTFTFPIPPLYIRFSAIASSYTRCSASLHLSRYR